MAWTTKDWLGGVNHSHQTVFSNVLQVLPIVKQFDVLFFHFFTSEITLSKYQKLTEHPVFSHRWCTFFILLYMNLFGIRCSLKFVY